ncbi:hypothetical protein I4U23_012538 [Adineta vaga]|nr:hypothetical protein I4U23_012538 [Adineta vaga]
MAILFQTTCLMVLLGMISSWPFPMLFERHPPPFAIVHTSIEEGPASPSLFDEMNKIMASMHERFEHMFDWRSLPVDFYDNGDYDTGFDEDRLDTLEDSIKTDALAPMMDDLSEIQKRLDHVQPVCTTITNTPTTVSPRKSRRKKLHSTHTTTCLRELIHNGQKHISEEINTTDDKGVVIQHSKSYSSMTLNTDQNKL